MKRRPLIQPVTVTGKNFLGFKSSITFLPTGGKGWFLRTAHNGDVPIDSKIARHKEGRIQLHAGGTTVNVWEHIGVLRFLGIDGVAVVINNLWPPYLGGVRGYYPYFLKEGVLKEDGELPLIKPLRYDSHESYNHLLAQTEIRPSEKLTLNVQARWGDLPWYKETLVIGELSEEKLTEILDSKPQGWLKGKQFFTTILMKIFKNLRKDDVAWVKNFKTPEDAAYAWGLHRVQDILGCLSLCDHKALPSMKFDSYLAGHLEDLTLLKKCFP